MRARAVWLGAGLVLAGCNSVPPDAPAARALDCPVPPGAGPWYATVAPSEHGNDSRRTHSYAAACSTVSTASRGQQTHALPGLPGLYNMVTREPGEVYALGGSFGHIAEQGGPYVARIDAHRLKILWRTSLPGIAATDWNYPGALGVHANGDLYAVYGHHIARLAAADGQVKAHARLPVNHGAADVAYNGFTLLSDGRIVAKSIHRQSGCRAPDFKAFLQCPTTGMAASSIALIDPESLAVEQALLAPEHIRFRVTATRLDAAEYVYLPGEERIRRYRYHDGALKLDESWSAAYRLPGQTPGTAVAALRDWIVIQTNGIPAETPLSIVAVSQRDASRLWRLEPFKDSRVQGSFIPSLPTVDEQQGRVYTFDAFAGEMAALDFDEDRGLRLAWKARQRSFAFSALVGPAGERVLVSTDLAGWRARLVFETLPPPLRAWLMRHNETPPKEDVVWRRAADGAELARAPAAAAVAGSVPTPGHYGWLFVPDLHDGALLRFTPAR